MNTGRILLTSILSPALILGGAWARLPQPFSLMTLALPFAVLAFVQSKQPLVHLVLALVGALVVLAATLAILSPVPASSSGVVQAAQGVGLGACIGALVGRVARRIAGKENE